jgi:hypothetical protein
MRGSRAFSDEDYRIGPMVLPPGAAKLTRSAAVLGRAARICPAENGSMRSFVRFRRNMRLEAVAAVLLLLWPINASAQYGRTFRTMVKLTDSDIAIVRKIVREDFTGKPNGTTIPWKNPESHNYGTVTLLDRFQSQGRDCRRVRYLVKPGAKQPAEVIPASYVLTTCQLADGTWKLDNSAPRDKSE